MLKRIYKTTCVILVLFVTSFGFFLPGQALQTRENSELAFDVVFVIDASGSMRKADADKLAIEASKLFTDMCEYASSRVGYVLYTQKLVSFRELTDISDEAQREELKKEITKITYTKNGDTDIALGLTEAMRILIQGNSVGSKRNPLIILLSDGNTDLPNGPRSVAESEVELAHTTSLLKGDHIPVYTIGLNADGSLDTQAMKNIADSTGAKFYETKSAVDLPGILSEIFANHINIKGLELLTFISDGTSRRVKIPIPNDSIYEANIVILSSKPTRDTHVYAPGGLEIVVPSEKVIQSTSTSYCLIKIINPSKGDWEVALIGAKDDKITINLLSSYDLDLKIQPLDAVYRGQPVDIAVAFSDGAGYISDTHIFDGAKGMLHVVEKATGQEKTFDLLQSDNKMIAEATFEAAGEYEAKAIMTGANDAFVKESPVYAFNVLPSPLTLVQKQISKTFVTWVLANEEYYISDLVKWDPTAQLAVQVEAGANGSLCDVRAEQETGKIAVHAKHVGIAEYSILFSDTFGQTAVITAKFRIIPVWPFIAALLLTLAVLAIALLIIKQKNLPRLIGKLSVGVEGTGQTPPEISTKMEGLRNGKGSIPLYRIAELDPSYGEVCKKALAAIGPFATNITITALDKEGSKIKVYIPSTKNGIVRLNTSEVTGSKNVTIHKNGELTVQYETNGTLYTIRIAFERESWSGGFETDGMFSDNVFDPFGGGAIYGTSAPVDSAPPLGGTPSKDPFGKDLFS